MGFGKKLKKMFKKHPVAKLLGMKDKSRQRAVDGLAEPTAKLVDYPVNRSAGAGTVSYTGQKYVYPS